MLDQTTLDKIDAEIKAETDTLTKFAPKPVPPRPKPSTAIEVIIAARESTHGAFIDVAAISQSLKFIMEETAGWERLSGFEAEALHLICTKIGRILAGNPNFKDHWDDIAGYAKLVAERV